MVFADFLIKVSYGKHCSREHLSYCLSKQAHRTINNTSHLAHINTPLSPKRNGESLEKLHFTYLIISSTAPQRKKSINVKTNVLIIHQATNPLNGNTL